MCDQDFKPEDWMWWMRATRALLKVGGVWVAPGPPPFVLEKTERGWKVRTGIVDSRTRLVCEAAGLELEE